MKLYLAISSDTGIPIRPTKARYGEDKPSVLRVYTSPARARSACRLKEGVDIIEIDTGLCPEVPHG